MTITNNMLKLLLIFSFVLSCQTPVKDNVITSIVQGELSDESGELVKPEDWPKDEPWPLPKGHILSMKVDTQPPVYQIAHEDDPDQIIREVEGKNSDHSKSVADASETNRGKEIADLVRQKLLSSEAIAQYSLDTKRHLYERLYRTSGKKTYIPLLANRAISLYDNHRRLISHLGKTKAKKKEQETYHRKRIKSYLSGNTFRQRRGQVFQDLTTATKGTTFLYEFSLLTYLRHIQEWGLKDMPPFKQDVETALSHLKSKKKELKKVLMHPDLIRTYSAQTDNYIHYMLQIKLMNQDEFGTFLKQYKKIFFDVLYQDPERMSDKVFREHIYGLTHFITAASGYYQHFVDADSEAYAAYKTIRIRLVKAVDRIIRFSKIDMIAEVGVVLRLFLKNEEDHPSVRKLKKALIKHFDDDYHLFVTSLEKKQADKKGVFSSYNAAEHRNVLAMMFLDWPKKMYRGPDLSTRVAPRRQLAKTTLKKFPQKLRTGLDHIKPVRVAQKIAHLVTVEGYEYNDYYSSPFYQKMGDEKTYFPTETVPYVVPLPYIEIPKGSRDVHIVEDGGSFKYRNHFIFKKNGKTMLRYFIHPYPDNIALHQKMIDSFGGIKGYYHAIPTSSPRSMIAWEPQNPSSVMIIKVSLNKVILGWRRVIDLTGGMMGVAVSSLFRQQDLLDHLVIVPENISIGFGPSWGVNVSTKTDNDQRESSSPSWAKRYDSVSMVVRDISQLLDNNNIWPGFSLFSRRLDKKGQRTIAPLLVEWYQQSKSSNWKDFITAHFIEPVCQLMAEAGAKYGFFPESHLQNFLVEVSPKTKKVRKLYLRDLGGYAYIDPNLMLARQFSSDMRQYPEQTQDYLRFFDKNSITKTGEMFYKPLHIIGNSAFLLKAKSAHHKYGERLEPFLKELDTEFVSSKEFGTIAKQCFNDALSSQFELDAKDITGLSSTKINKTFGQLRSDFIKRELSAPIKPTIKKKKVSKSFKTFVDAKIAEGKYVTIPELQIDKTFKVGDYHVTETYLIFKKDKKLHLIFFSSDTPEFSQHSDPESEIPSADSQKITKHSDRLNNVLNHQLKRFHDLERILDKDPKYHLKFPGRSAETHALGAKIAKKKWDADEHAIMIDSIKDNIQNLESTYPDRIHFGWIGDWELERGKNNCTKDTVNPHGIPGEASDGTFIIHIWGANHTNFNYSTGRKGPFGKGQASCFSSQRPGVFGISTMPGGKSDVLLAADNCLDEY